jgi:dTDP-4-amino-4,6-dideoxygalactose transaminase
MHDYDSYSNHPLVVRDSTPLAASIATEVLSLPVHQHLSDEDLDAVAEAVTAALR